MLARALDKSVLESLVREEAYTLYSEASAYGVVDRQSMTAIWRLFRRYRRSRL